MSKKAKIISKGGWFVVRQKFTLPKKPRIGWKATVSIDFGWRDSHYRDNLIAGAKILELFGDAATKLCLRETGGKNEGLLRAYKEVEFLSPVHVGDTVEAIATIVRIGNTSREMKFQAFKIRQKKKLVCRAIGTVVVR